MQYVWGADGSGRKVDCIHMVLYALADMGIPAPPLDKNWYGMSTLAHHRLMKRWGNRVKLPAYDGDIIWLGADAPTFAVVWDNGILFINGQAQRVMWSPIKTVLAGKRFAAYRYCPTSVS